MNCGDCAWLDLGYQWDRVDLNSKVYRCIQFGCWCRISGGPCGHWRKREESGEPPPRKGMW